MSYKHWKKISEDSESVIYQSKAEEIRNRPEIQKDGIIRKIRTEVKKVGSPDGGNYMADICYVLGNYDHDGNFQLEQYEKSRATGINSSSKSGVVSQLSKILDKASYKVAQSYIERRTGTDELRNGEEGGVPIESHYAPYRIECPECRVIGEVTYNDATTSFRCGACGNESNMPDEVKTV